MGVEGLHHSAGSLLSTGSADSIQESTAPLQTERLGCSYHRWQQRIYFSRPAMLDRGVGEYMLALLLDRSAREIS